MKDYYSTLGVAKDANKDEIKKAFRKLSREFHPDLNPNNKEAEEKFKKINEAYSTLSNNKKRHEYDMYSSADRNVNYGRPTFEDMFEGFGINFDDFFGGRTQRRARQSVDEVVINLEIPLADIKGGCERILNINNKITCDPCDGSGGEDTIVCLKCNGRGIISVTKRMGTMTFSSNTPCGVCHGQGRIIKKICKKCDGLGIINIKESYKIKLTSEKI